ncbi:MAG: hypothetical protein GF307_14985 [candidate division Zixibacteria bacterium]|nr:hypothetical protein [candidate division Zixibacteria bacterium]
MRNLISLLSILFIILGAVLPVENAVSVTLTIDEALKRAYSHNRTYLQALQEVKKASARIVEARAGAFPVISFAGDYTRNWEPNVFYIAMGDEVQKLKIGQDNSWSAGISLTQPIWLGGKVGTALSIAKTYKKYSRQSLVTAYNEVRLEVYRKYYGFILAREMVRVAEKAYDLAKSNRENVDKMFSKGTVSEFDLLRAKVDEANAMPPLIEARSAAKTAEDALKSTLGMELSEDINAVEEFKIAEADTILKQPVEYYRSMALKRRSELKELEYTIEMLDKNIRLEKSAYLPSLIFNTNLAWVAQRDDWKLTSDDWSRSITSSIQLQIPIFEGFGRSAKVKQAHVDKTQSELGYQQLKDGVELEVNNAYGELKKAIENYNAQQKTVEMAREGLRISELRYKNGIGTQLEVKDARTALIRAETNLVNARHGLAVSRAAFEKAIGIIEPDIEK